MKFCVVAEIIGTANTNKNGLQSSTSAFTIEDIYLEAGATKQIRAQGLLFIKHQHSWGGYELWWLSFNKAIRLATADWNTSIKIEVAGYNYNTWNISLEGINELRELVMMYQKIE